MIKELLFENNLNNTLKTSKVQENFILTLLQENPEVLKTLNIDKKDILKVIENLPKDKQKKFLEVLNKLFQKKTSIDLKNTIQNIKTLKNIKEETKNLIEDTKELTPKNKKNSDEKETKDFTQKIANNISQIFFQDNSKVLNIIKEEIEYKIKTKKITLSQDDYKKFKEIKTLNELINFANEKKLNIKKIIYSQKVASKINEVLKEENSLHNLPKPKITITNTIIHKKHDTKKSKLENTSIINKLVKYPKKDLSNNTTKETKNINIQNIIQKENIFQTELKTKENLTLETNSKEKLDLHSKDTKTPEISINIPQITKEIKHNIISAKQTLKHFASNLQEAIKEYKPPIHKLSIELNPKELGKVEVTLIHRGENLQIQINSNQTSTISFFNTNQNELKNILVNMGYNEVNMSFNSNDHQQQKQQYKQNQNKFTKDEDEGFTIEMTYTYA